MINRLLAGGSLPSHNRQPQQFKLSAEVFSFLFFFFPVTQPTNVILCHKASPWIQRYDGEKKWALKGLSGAIDWPSREIRRQKWYLESAVCTGRLLLSNDWNWVFFSKKELHPPTDTLYYCILCGRHTAIILGHPFLYISSFKFNLSHPFFFSFFYKLLPWLETAELNSLNPLCFLSSHIVNRYVLLV